MSGHPLDRAAWHALTTRQSAFAVGDARAVRLAPGVGLFAAAADGSPESGAALARLVAEAGTLWTIEREPAPAPPGLRIAERRSCVQMTLTRIGMRPTNAESGRGEPPDELVVLGEADAAAMLALATLTRPGPFFARTHRLGRFLGVRREGRLVAMAGERLRPPGHTEVSGVCTHPDHRGRGHAARLMRAVAEAILARGETPFLTCYADRLATIALYERLGFRTRATIAATVLAPA